MKREIYRNDDATKLVTRELVTREKKINSNLVKFRTSPKQCKF